ncbi:MAG: acetyl/propionyl/methylcrotonyl-CoA carboxylase subunit alpha [Acidiphilium sp.]
MFGSVLIANRGEIACRIVRTARRMGLRSVAVFSDADRAAAHVAAADAAIRIGPAPARESYLDIGRIIEAARRTGAEAVHPGYGFLSENADFAEACAEAGLIFVGPPASAIRAMGSKSAAKALMERAGVPLVPGYHGDDQNPRRLAEAAAAIGFPVLVKASAGGGGKGMRVVRDAADFAAELERAKAEALAAFGDDRVLIEKYLTKPRHIEIQVFADTHGKVLSLHERDCSIQRRHQKIVEEAPAPGIDDEFRRAMAKAARDAARAIDYVGAGTVEFIVEDGGFHFMEMNTRLQVEHPVTEMITGLDLVEWQFRVAAGEALPFAQEDIARHGHAIEARLYAEDPARDFAPSTGTLALLRLPQAGPDVRIESGVREGDVVSVHYDPMIAKLVVWGEDRAAAIRRLDRALAEAAVDGVSTNLDLLRRIALHPDFAAARLDTGFIGHHEAALMPAPAPAETAMLAMAAHRWLHAHPPAVAPADPHSPWATRGTWRLNGAGFQDLAIEDGTTTHRLRLHPIGEGRFDLDIEGRTCAVTVDAGDTAEEWLVGVDDVVRRMRASGAEGRIAVFVDGERRVLTVLDPHRAEGDAAAAGGLVTTAMPGRVVEVAVAPGTRVAAGDLLLVIEAMKVQFRVAAPRAGVIGAVNCAAGDLVEEGAELVVFAD